MDRARAFLTYYTNKSGQGPGVSTWLTQYRRPASGKQAQCTAQNTHKAKGPSLPAHVATLQDLPPKVSSTQAVTQQCAPSSSPPPPGLPPPTGCAALGTAHAPLANQAPHLDTQRVRRTTTARQLPHYPVTCRLKLASSWPPPAPAPVLPLLGKLPCCTSHCSRSSSCCCCCWC